MVESNVPSSTTLEQSDFRQAERGQPTVSGISRELRTMEETTPKAVQYKKLSRSAESMEHKKHNKGLSLLGRKHRVDVWYRSEKSTRDRAPGSDLL